MRPQRLLENRREVVISLLVLGLAATILLGIFFSSQPSDIRIEVINMSGESGDADTLWVEIVNKEDKVVQGLVRTSHKYSSTYSSWEKPNSESLIDLEPGKNIVHLKADREYSRIPNGTWFKVIFSEPFEEWWVSTPRMNSAEFMN